MTHVLLYMVNSATPCITVHNDPHALFPTNHPLPHPTLATKKLSNKIKKINLINKHPPSSLAIQTLINITLWGENDRERDGRQEKKVSPMLVDAIEEDKRVIEDHSQDVHYVHLSSWD
jgi:hypothetical protein